MDDWIVKLCWWADESQVVLNRLAHQSVNNELELKMRTQYLRISEEFTRTDGSRSVIIETWANHKQRMQYTWLYDIALN